MSKPVLLSLGAGKVQELVGTANNDVLTWDSTLDGGSWKSAAGGGGGGSGTVTSVGLTGGTSGIVIGGATSPITSSGTYNLDAPLRFAFNTTAPEAVAAAGQVAWNDTEGSLDSMLKGGNVVASLGQQVYQRVVNADSVTLTKGMVVYVFGSSGTRISVKRALADADLTSAAILGVVAESITAGQAGFVMTSGLMKALSVLPTASFADGAVVYLSPTTAGGLTTTKPTAPNHIVTVGYVAKGSNGSAGELLVHPQNGYEIEELHDVYVNNPTSGQLLIYDATAGQTRWENASLTGGTGVTVTSGPGSLSVAIGQSVATSASPTFAGLTLTSFSGLLRATAGVLAGGATVALGSEVSGTLPVANGGTGAATTQANKVFAGPTAGADAAPNFRALVAADVAGLTPYDLSGEFVGTPASSAVIMRFVAARAFTFGGTAYFACATAPTSTATFTVSVNGTSKGQVTIASSATAGTGTITSTNVGAGDLVTVVATTPAAIVSPYWTLPGTV